MAKEEVFNRGFDELLQPDDSLDVNEILGGTTPPTIKEDPEKEEDPKKPEEIDLNVNEILAKSKPDEEEESEESEEGAPAPSPKPDDDIDDKSASSDTPFAVIFARDLVEQGLLSSFDEEEFKKSVDEKGPAEAVRDLYRSEIDHNISQYKEGLDEGYKQYLELTGMGVPPESASDLSTLQQSLSSIEEDKLVQDDQEDLRRQILTQYYSLTSQMSDKKIETLVQRSIDLGEDIEESKDALKNLKGLVSEEIERVKQEAEVVKQKQLDENKRQLEKLKEDIYATKEIIPNQSINKQTKDKMYDAIVKPIEDKNGNVTNAIWAKRAENPFLFDSRLAYLLLTGFFEDKPWDKVKTVKVSKEASMMEDFLSKNKNTGVTPGTGAPAGEITKEKLADIINSTQSILKNK